MRLMAGQALRLALFSDKWHLPQVGKIIQNIKQPVVGNLYFLIFGHLKSEMIWDIIRADAVYPPGGRPDRSLTSFSFLTIVI